MTYCGGGSSASGWSTCNAVRPPSPVGWQGPPGWLTAAGGPPPWRPVFVRGAVGSRRSARPGRPSVRPRPRGGGRQRDSRPPSPANSAQMLARGRLRGCPAECAPRHGSRAASARAPARISRSKASLSSRAASARGPASPWVWSSSACGRLGVRRGRSRRARSSWTRLRPGERALAYMNVARRRVHLGGSAFTCSEARSPGWQRVHPRCRWARGTVAPARAAGGLLGRHRTLTPLARSPGLRGCLRAVVQFARGQPDGRTSADPGTVDLRPVTGAVSGAGAQGGVRS